jgi:hypothetical protein
VSQAKTAKKAASKGPWPKRQVPMFLPEQLRAVVEAMPALLQERAHALHRIVLASGRTWLEVAAAEADALRIPLASVLAGGKDKHALASAARRRAWWTVKHGMGRRIGDVEIARAFGVYPNAVVWGLRQRAAEIEAEKKTPASPVEKGEVHHGA